MQELDVSIILVNYNTKELTRNCLNSLYEKTTELKFDIWVVDNASNDGSCEMIKQEFPDVKLLENKENLGFGKANNLAIRESKAKYVFLLNTDTVLVNNAVKVLFDFMENNDKAGACGGNLYDANNSHVHSYGFFNTPRMYLFKMLGIKCLLEKKCRDHGHNENNELKKVDIIVGADLMLRKAVLDEVGLFDEKFFLYSEEKELQFRITNRGYDIFIVPSAAIIHLEGSTTKKNRKKRRQIIAESEYLYFKLCYPKMNRFLLRCLISSSILYRALTAPGYTFKALKYIWSN